MENKEEIEKELNALRDLLIRYVDGNLTDEENARVKKAKRYIRDIVYGHHISLDENISDEQILAIYDEYSKRLYGSQTLGIGTDLARGAEKIAPYAAVVLLAAMGVENSTDLARSILAHHAIIAILGGDIARDVVGIVRDIVNRW